MKQIFFVLLFFGLAGAGGAQVYTFTCKYAVQIISSKHFSQFERIDTGNHFRFSVDLDKMIISNPVAFDDDLGPIPITEVERHDDGRLLILHTKRKDGYKWNYYQMQLGANFEPTYIELAERMKGGDADTFFHVHTNNLSTLFFRKECLFVKDTVFTAGAGTDAQTKALSHVKFRLADNTVEMRDGVITWRENRNVQHRAVITETILEKYPGTEGIVAHCREGDISYDVGYVMTDRNMDMDDKYSTLYILFRKYVQEKLVSVTIAK